MSKHRVWFVGLVVAMTLMLTGAASAWEFTMTGSYTWLYETRGQLGRNGFFGPYDVDAGAGTFTNPDGTTFTPGPGFYAPVNGFVGELLGNFVSGTDSQRNVMYMTNDMDLRINPALRVRGQYFIGEWGPVGTPGAAYPHLLHDHGEGNLVASQYLNSRFPGTQRSFSPGYWNMLWLSAQLPWGEVVMGKRRSAFGMGMYYNGEESRTSEKLAVAVPYGPFRFVIGFDAGRRIDDSSNYPLDATTAGGGFAAVAGPSSTAGYFNQDGDKNNSRWWDTTIASITYRSGDLDVGATVNPVRWHKGGEGILNTPANRARVAYRDREEFYGAAYVKYNNGRFFFNSEVDWYQQINRNRRRAAGGVAPDITASRDTYIENWRFVTETGILCGPSKLAFLYAWAAGPDRRRGVQIDRTGLVTPAGRVSSSFSNTGLFRPYSYLAVYGYGLGTHINADTINGYVEDASIWAARLDYAVASNLNVYGSFFWADRVSQSGWGWGFIRPVAAPPAAGSQLTVPAGGTLVLTRDTSRTGAPSIPDTNLGWEIDSGFDWKLLEGFLVQATFAYWQPGNWFKFACVDKSVPGWATVSGGTAVVNGVGGGNTNPASWGINPDRAIDAIWGLELNVKAEF